jgi:hypothetical protein
VSQTISAEQLVLNSTETCTTGTKIRRKTLIYTPRGNPAELREDAEEHQQKPLQQKIRNTYTNPVEPTSRNPHPFCRDFQGKKKINLSFTTDN